MHFLCRHLLLREKRHIVLFQHPVAIHQEKYQQINVKRLNVSNY